MQRPLGRSKKNVFPIGLGAMPLSLQQRPPEPEAIKVIHAALEAGVDLIDTANVYCLDDSDIGHNERLIAKALATHPAGKGACVATKGGLSRPGGAWKANRGAPAKLAEACEQSLQALGCDSIFLYQLHAPTDDARFADSVGALLRLQEQGKIQHIGLSNVSVAQLEQALQIARIESVQNRCNVQDQRDVNNGLLALCAEHDVAYIAYSPVGGGHQHTSLARYSPLVALAKTYGVSPYVIALSWVLGLGEHVIAIPGASKVASILDSARAATCVLRPADRARL